MNTATKLRYYIESLCIYDLKNDEVISKLLDLLKNTRNEEVLSKQSIFFNSVSAHESLKSYISMQILTNENVFTKAAAGGKADELSEFVIKGVKSDLMKLEAISNIKPEDILCDVSDDNIRSILSTMPKWETGTALNPLEKHWENQTDDLCAFHKKNGYGMFAEYIAFTWRNHSLFPISSTDSIALSDLKGYEIPRQKVVDNTESFVKGYPANNVLLYGDRGTGKSSTVHAVLNEYSECGLRMIEISKNDIPELTVIRELIADSPMKFIIFIDDLCFDSHEDSFGALKAALEGSLSGKKANTLIYATSNRRHLIKESFSDRENDINKNDIMQEQLSLSDRFGLSITFVNPNKSDYLSIVSMLADDRGICVDKEKLFLVAEQWASKKGGRSPRCAKQFIDYVESAEMRSKNW